MNFKTKGIRDGILAGIFFALSSVLTVYASHALFSEAKLKYDFASTIFIVPLKETFAVLLFGIATKFKYYKNLSELFSKKNIPMMFSGLFNSLGWLLLIVSSFFIQSSISSVIGQTELIAVFIIAVLFLKDKVNWKAGIAAIIMFSIIIIESLIGQSFSIKDWNSFTIGSVLAFGSAISWALVQIISDKYSRKHVTNIREAQYVAALQVIFTAIGSYIIFGILHVMFPTEVFATAIGVLSKNSHYIIYVVIAATALALGRKFMYGSALFEVGSAAVTLLEKIEVIAIPIFTLLFAMLLPISSESFESQVKLLLSWQFWLPNILLFGSMIVFIYNYEIKREREINEG